MICDIGSLRLGSSVPRLPPSERLHVSELHFIQFRYFLCFLLSLSLSLSLPSSTSRLHHSFHFIHLQQACCFYLIFSFPLGIHQSLHPSSLASSVCSHKSLWYLQYHISSKNRFVCLRAERFVRELGTFQVQTTIHKPARCPSLCSTPAKSSKWHTSFSIQSSHPPLKLPSEMTHQLSPC